MISVFASTTALLSSEFVDCFPADKLGSILFKAGKESGITYSRTKKTFSITGQWKQVIGLSDNLQHLVDLQLELEYGNVGNRTPRNRKSGIGATIISNKKSDLPAPFVYEYKEFMSDELISSATVSQESANIHLGTAEESVQSDASKEECDNIEIVNDSSSSQQIVSTELPKNHIAPNVKCTFTDKNEGDIVVKTEYYSDEDTEIESNIDYTELLDAAEQNEDEKHIPVKIKTENAEFHNSNDDPKVIDNVIIKPPAEANRKSRRKSQPVKRIHSIDTDSAHGAGDAELTDHADTKKRKSPITKNPVPTPKAKKETVPKQPKKKGRKKKKQEEEDGHFPCSKCEYVGTKKSNLKEHGKRQHREVMHACEVCGKKFGFNKDLKRHLRTVHVEPKYFCNNCNKFYKSKRVFDEHILTHNEDYVKPNFNCDVCDKSFSTKYVLATHVKAEHLGMKKSYLCPTCGRSFTQKNSYTMHANVHAGIKPYVCDVCGKAFTYDKSLKEHKFMHDNLRRFTCSVCAKTFRQTTSLKIHMKVHKETKDYICTACGKGFTQKQALLRHERIHSGDKPYVCALCSRTFSDYSIIRRHMLLIHKKDPTDWRGDIISNLKKRKDYYIDGGPGHHKRDMTGPTFDEKAMEEADGNLDDPVKKVEDESFEYKPENHLVTETLSTDENRIQDLSQNQPVFPGTSYTSEPDIPQPSPAMSDTDRSQISMPINYSLPQNYSSSVSSSPAPEHVTESEESLASRYQSVVEAYRDLHAQRELYSPPTPMSASTTEPLRSPLPYQTVSPASSEALEEQIARPHQYSYAGYPPYYNPANFSQYPGPQS